MEYMDGGSAIDYIRKEHSRLTHIDLLTILSDIAEAGQHLCEMGVVHRDIGARNVLVRTIRKYAAPAGTIAPPSLIAKLTDFGLAKDVGQGLEAYQSITRTCVFHMRYTAPEGFTGNFSYQSDVWSWGVLAWELYASMDHMLRYGSTPSTSAPVGFSTTSTLVVPYAQYAEQQDIFDAVCSGIRLEHSKLTPLAIRKLISTCWALQLKSRPRFDQLTKSIKTAINNLRGANNRIGLRAISATVRQQETSQKVSEEEGGRDTTFASPVDSAMISAGYSGWK